MTEFSRTGIGETISRHTMKMDVAHLKIVAAELNQVSDDFNQTVVELDAMFHSLNLGIPIWVEFQQEPEIISVGYDKVEGKWGLSLMRSLQPLPIPGTQFVNRPEDDQWLYQNAPRYMRILAIHAIPQLIRFAATKARELTEMLRDAKTEMEKITGQL